MSASLAEIQELADQILACMGLRMHGGQMVIHFSEGHVQRVEINTVHKLHQPASSPLRRPTTLKV